MGSHSRSSIMGPWGEGELFLKNLDRSFTRGMSVPAQGALCVMKGKGKSSRPPEELCQKGQHPCTCVCREEPPIPEEEVSSSHRCSGQGCSTPCDLVYTHKEGLELSMSLSLFPSYQGKRRAVNPQEGWLLANHVSQRQT